MSKPPKKYVENKSFFLWPYEEQTKVKHKVLIEYFKVWATKLGAYYTVVFIDCFGGCGAYLDNNSISYGSPFLVAEVASELKKTLGRKIEIYVTEPDKENYENLMKIREELLNDFVVLPQIGNCRFEDLIQHIVRRRLRWVLNCFSGRIYDNHLRRQNHVGE